MEPPTIDGYLAEPNEPSSAGVVLAHDWFGLLPGVPRYADDLAANGFVAFAPDLYDGRSTTDPQEAESLMNALDKTEAQERLVLVLDHLLENGCNRVGIVGWSLGGMLALRAATQGRFDACVAYYAALEPEKAVPISCPVLAHLAEVDDWPSEDIAELYFGRLADAEVATYAGTEHSFANDDAKQFDPNASQQAWKKTVGFLREKLIALPA